jgi:hypothetical protein
LSEGAQVSAIAPFSLVKALAVLSPWCEEGGTGTLFTSPLGVLSKDESSSGEERASFGEHKAAKFPVSEPEASSLLVLTGMGFVFMQGWVMM